MCAKIGSLVKDHSLARCATVTRILTYDEQLLLIATLDKLDCSRSYA